MDLPLLAYGTWVEHIQDAPSIVNRVHTAIEFGYTHIDTAHVYGTESFVIEAIKQSGISRDSIFLTSKVRSLIDAGTLRINLGHLQYYDLLLLHYPPLYTRNRKEFKEALLPLWNGMTDYIKSGITRFIGVSNFYQNHLDVLLEICDENALVRPLVNQLEIHPGNLELNYVPYMQSQGIQPFAHTPLGGLGSKYLLNNEILIEIGERIQASPAQVTLAYLLKRGIGVVTSSKNPIHMNESIHSVKFIDAITDNDIEAINSTEINMGPIIEGSIMSWEDNSLLY